MHQAKRDVTFESAVKWIRQVQDWFAYQQIPHFALRNPEALWASVRFQAARMAASSGLELRQLRLVLLLLTCSSCPPAWLPPTLPCAALPCLPCRRHDITKIDRPLQPLELLRYLSEIVVSRWVLWALGL